MNRYFIFKKVRSVDVKKMAEVILKEQAIEERNSEDNLKELENMIDERELSEQPIVKKKQRLVLKKPVKKDNLV